LPRAVLPAGLPHGAGFLSLMNPEASEETREALEPAACSVSPDNEMGGACVIVSSLLRVAVTSCCWHKFRPHRWGHARHRLEGWQLGPRLRLSFETRRHPWMV